MDMDFLEFICVQELVFLSAVSAQVISIAVLFLRMGNPHAIVYNRPTLVLKQFSAP